MTLLWSITLVALRILAAIAVPPRESQQSFIQVQTSQSSFLKANGITLQSNGAEMKKEYPFYHTSAELSAKVQDLAKNCNGMLTTHTATDKETGMEIEVIDLKAPDAQPVNRVFMLFGEHSRELISPESGLYLLQVLCGAEPAESSVDLPKVLQANQFQMVLNGNPKSRAKVENGEYCLRMNENDVDLNRNWDEHFERGASNGASTNAGETPFSEPETRIFKQLVTDFKPTTFLTVHSGTRGMYMPWAYDREHLADRNQAEMLEILRDLDQDHCQCPFGAAGKEVGYSCPGTCLDWVYDQLKAPYAFAFEIYVNPDSDESLKRRWDEKIAEGGLSLLQEGENLGHPHFRDVFDNHPSSFVQLSAAARDLEQDDAACFGNFNPPTQEKYDEVVKNWATTYLEMSQKVASRLSDTPL